MRKQKEIENAANSCELYSLLGFAVFMVFVALWFSWFSRFTSFVFFAVVPVFPVFAFWLLAPFLLFSNFFLCEKTGSATHRRIAYVAIYIMNHHDRQGTINWTVFPKGRRNQTKRVQHHVFAIADVQMGIGKPPLGFGGDKLSQDAEALVGSRSAGTTSHRRVFCSTCHSSFLAIPWAEAFWESSSHGGW